MATYTKVFADPYPNGWKSKPDLSTPYTTEIRDNHDVTLRAIESYLNEHPIIDVSNTSPSNGQILKWDETSSKYIPGSPVMSLAGLTDVNLKYGYYDGQDHYDVGKVLMVKSVYDSEVDQNVNKFVPVKLTSIDDLEDVSISASSKVNGNVLAWNSTIDKLTLQTSSGGGISYSTNETVIGTDENGNTLYSKTYIETLDPEDGIDGGTFSIISTKHRILHIEAFAYVKYNNGTADKIAQFSLPFSQFYGDSITYKFLENGGELNIEYNDASNSVPNISWNLYFRYNNVIYYPFKIRVTAHYVKVTT